MNLLTEIENDLPNLVWNEESLPDVARKEDPTVKSYVGASLKHRLLVVSFDIESQGFPKGSRGYDGTAIRNGTIMRLPRELAEKAFKAAHKTQMVELLEENSE